MLAPMASEWPLDLQRGTTKLVLRVRPQAAPENGR